MDSPDLLRQAITAAKAGRPQQARAMFLRVVKTEPRNELAWLWLSEVGSGWEDRIGALEKALEINPGNTAARARLEDLRSKQQAARAQQAARSQALWQQARQALRARRRPEALDLLLQLVREDERQPRAWFLLSDLVPDVEDQIAALENVLALDPRRRPAQSRLNRLRRLRKNPLVLGVYYEQRGDVNRAMTAYLTADAEARSPEERDEAGQRFAELQARHSNSSIRVISPTVTLLRLSLGLPVLYTLLIFIQGGLNPLRISPILALGALSVLLGSFLIVMTSLKPRHPLWLMLFWEPGGGSEALARQVLSRLGWTAALVPYVLWLLSAVERLRMDVFVLR